MRFDSRKILKSSKCVCGRGSARNRWESSQRYPRLPGWIWEGERTEEGRGGKGLELGSGEKERDRRGAKEGREGQLKPLPKKNPGCGLALD